MLEGWDNDRIFNYIKENQLDDKYKTPLSKDFLYSTRWKLRRDGIFEKMERDKKAKKKAEVEEEAKKDLPDSNETATNTTGKNEESGDSPPEGRPEWAVMTAAQIDLIEDPALKAQILEYRTYKDRQRLAAQQPYVTNEQLNYFKNEVSGRMTKLEGDLIGIKDSNQQILTAINKITGESGEANTSQEAVATPTTASPVTTATPGNPYGNLTREEAIDLLINRPVVVKARARPREEVHRGRGEGKESRVRPQGLEPLHG